MKDPQPLLEYGANQLEFTLLRAGDADGPSPRAREAALAALGVSVAVLSSSTSVAGAASGAPLAQAAPVVAAKWWAIGALVAASSAGVGFATFASDAEQVPRAPVARGSAPKGGSSTAPSPTVAVPAAEEPIVVAPPGAAAVGESDSGLVARRAAAPGAVSIQEQIALIDRARAAAAAGKPALVLSTLDTYQRRFPKGVLAQEAALLRIEARLASGDTADATRLGQQFLQRYPRSALTPRLRSQLEKNGP